jgi:hypothetical protein
MSDTDKPKCEWCGTPLRNCTPYSEGVEEPSQCVGDCVRCGTRTWSEPLIRTDTAFVEAQRLTHETLQNLGQPKLNRELAELHVETQQLKMGGRA